MWLVNTDLVLLNAVLTFYTNVYRVRIVPVVPLTLLALTCNVIDLVSAKIRISLYSILINSDHEE